MRRNSNIAEFPSTCWIFEVSAKKAALKWVREQTGKVKDAGTPERVVNIKKKYMGALEKIEKLMEENRFLREEIARLNRLVKINNKFNDPGNARGDNPKKLKRV